MSLQRGAYESAYDANINYYLAHPEKYSRQKIDRETWLPVNVREAIKDALDNLTGAKAKRERQQAQFINEAGTTPEEIQANKKEQKQKAIQSSIRVYERKVDSGFYSIEDILTLQRLRRDYRNAR